MKNLLDIENRLQRLYFAAHFLQSEMSEKIQFISY